MKKIHFPTTRFAELASRHGGVTRATAVEAATKNIESSRPESDAMIEKSVAAIEAIVGREGALNSLSEKDLRAILVHGDQIVTLAGLFGYDALDAATRSLCDLTEGLLDAGTGEAEPILVHAQAMRLMAPGSPVPPPEEAAKVLAGLQRILTHFQIERRGHQIEHDIGDDVFEVG